MSFKAKSLVVPAYRQCNNGGWTKNHAIATTSTKLYVWGLNNQSMWHYYSRH
jgi:hypothetical protein